MAVKGTEAKQKVTQEILNAFGDQAFLYNDGKEIRINAIENGEPVQIKVVLTAAKVAVTPDGENAIPGAAAPRSAGTEWNFDESKPSATIEPPPAPSVDEKQNVADLLRSLGL